MTSQPGSESAHAVSRSHTHRSRQRDTGQHQGGSFVSKPGPNSNMANAGNGKEKGDRKRKLKFSEQELEVLTEEVVRNHDRLFGKNSLQVPESEKRKLWSDIQTKICAVGVAQRSVEEIRKRWYDLRSRAKERVASRLKEARSTGGGPSTQTPSTPMEDLVESTLLPEAVSGVTDIDTSGTPSTSKDAPGPAAAESENVGEPETQPQSDSNTSESYTIAPTRRRARVLPLPEYNLDSDEMPEEEPTPPPEASPTGRQQSLRQRQSTPLRRRHDAGRQCTDEGEGPSIFGGLEASMLKVQRLQCKHMRLMHRQLVSHNDNMGVLHKQLETLIEGQQTAAENTKELTHAIRELCTEIRQERVSHRRRHHQFMGRFDGFCRSVNRLASSTALISRRAVAIQVEMAHCSRDVAQGLVQITNVLDAMQTARSATTSELGGGDSEELSSLSSLTAPAMDPRRRSTRHSTACDPATRGASEGTEHSSGVRGRRK